MTTMFLAHGGHFAVYLFPVGAIVFLIWLLKKEAPKPSKDASTPTVLPRNPMSRQVFTATRPKTPRVRTTAPKNGGFRPPANPTPLRPPPTRQDRRGA